MPTDGTARDSFADNCGAPVSFAEGAKKAFQRRVDLMKTEFKANTFTSVMRQGGEVWGSVVCWKRRRGSYQLSLLGMPIENQ